MLGEKGDPYFKKKKAEEKSNSAQHGRKKGKKTTRLIRDLEWD